MMRHVIVTLLAIAFLAGSHLSADEVNLPKFIQETQRSEPGPEKIRLIWWVPTEYWKVTLKRGKNLTDQQIEEFCKVLDVYTVFIVVDAKMSAFAAIQPIARPDVESRLSLTVGQDDKLKPLAEAEVSAEAKNVFAMMKPLMANALGQFGRGIEFFCFKGTNAEGKRLLDPMSNGFFSLNLGPDSYKWRLPLGSLLPPKHDPQTKEEFPGNYLFNPFTGAKLHSK